MSLSHLAVVTTDTPHKDFLSVLYILLGIIIALAGIAYIVGQWRRGNFKADDDATQQVINNQKELIDTLKLDRDEYKDAHAKALSKVADMEGRLKSLENQVAELKTIPLQKLEQHMQAMTTTLNKIDEHLEKTDKTWEMHIDRVSKWIETHDKQETEVHIVTKPKKD